MLEFYTEDSTTVIENLKDLFLSPCSQTGFKRTRRALYKGTELIRYKFI
ncbi:hypothetical protein JK636_00905 [Clostridium sp. YIM B02515]|uniref:Uncharacterized protein n=1 Tax=Clostridium rhizosphaerae TaxID=2803861 RepID=A0ABS1T7I7_9CLOT|nr:hypothetical protein [Clostridium rhizosphaerae]MBL4934309.1 hypothetical protein [Clostridium rhizosphaerae]